MPWDSDLNELKRRHEATERAMALEKTRRGAGDRTRAELKRRTLLLKEAIARQR
jgi:hypothetical protein